jgi:hypothetical protein
LQNLRYPSIGFASSSSLSIALGTMKPTITPSGVLIVPKAVLIARSLSPNHADATLLIVFRNDTYPYAAMAVPKEIIQNSLYTLTT